MDEIFGTIERITFQNEETGFTVAHIRQSSHKELTCVVGSLYNVQPGETVRLKGQWKNHLIHGSQFAVEECQTVAPRDLLGIKKYLGSGLIKGIGPVFAKKITDRFGIETLHIIDTSPEKLLEIPGVGSKKMERIKSCWDEQKVVRDVMIFLQSHGISPTYAHKIFKNYGDKSIAKIKENPYRLARDIFGIGFKTADTIATKMGTLKDSPERIDAGIEYVLTTLSEEGHVCYPLGSYLSVAQNVLEVTPELISERIQALSKENRVMLFDILHELEMTKFIWLMPLFIAETGIARELNRILQGVSQIRSIDSQRALNWIQTKLSIELAPNQKKAICETFENKVHIITGGPGTGKSTITKAILGIAEMLTSRILLAAPTGRAAKRMTEITGMKAFTIHSMLEIDFKSGGFKKNKDNPLECDLIIIDEASMIDTKLMYHLLKAIPTSCKVVFVGDIHQLPSIGAGNVLRDLIDTTHIPVTTLIEIFRQAQGSRIITNSHKINQGILPDLTVSPGSDFFFIEEEEPQKIIQTIVSLVTVRIPKKYGHHPIDEIQVLSAMKKGEIGILNLNLVLQEALNPRSEEPLFRAGKRFFKGDKVMQMRNNYKKEVFNGDVGRIDEINLSEQTVKISFDLKQVDYEFSDLDELQLAYAVSIHKYQGSECPCIIMPCHTSQFMMLHRNLLYTGVTRGKKLVILVGSKKALIIAVNNDEVKKRYTGLISAIRGLVHA